MNVLILTPDAVGSTLLQRLLTIYMQFHEFDRPVINLHEITNGLEKYFSTDFNREIISKRYRRWGYHQSLENIVDMLDSVDHYKIARLAQYHVKNRRDSIEHQIPFYRYLDDNFFVIACRRHNVFEHALSRSLAAITKKLNVYSHQEKLDMFIDMYVNPIEIDQEMLLGQIEAYHHYVSWSEDHFRIGSYFYLDQHLDNIETFILNLPIFCNQSERVGWRQKFGIEFNDWNRLHHVMSDLGLLNMDSIRSLRMPEQERDRVLTHDIGAAPDEHGSSSLVRVDSVCHNIQLQCSDAQDFVTLHRPAYDRAQEAIARMQQLDIISSPPPIKKHTLSEKIRMIRNFDQCVDTFNDWVRHHPGMGGEITQDQISSQMQNENQFWRSFATQAPSLGVS